MPLLKVTDMAPNEQTKLQLSLLYTAESSVAINGPHPAHQAFLGTVLEVRPEMGQYITLNSIDGRRSRAAVTYFRNFLLEIDQTSLQHQVFLLHQLAEVLPIRCITFSGNKSMHAIVSLADMLVPDFGGEDSAALYSGYARALMKAVETFFRSHAQEPYDGELLDTGNIDPARLTRLAGATHQSTGALQQLQFSGELCSSEQLLTFLQDYAPKTAALTPQNKTAEYILNFEHTLDVRSHLRPLRHKLKLPQFWAGPANNHPKLFNYCLWAIDSTGVEKKELMDYINKYTAPHLLTLGYPSYKIEAAVEGAYRLKNYR